MCVPGTMPFIHFSKLKSVYFTAAGDVQIDPSNTDEGCNAFLDKVHQALNPLDLEFRSVLDDNSNTKLFALVRHYVILPECDSAEFWVIR